MTNDEKIEKIQQEFKQLSQKQLELSKSHQQQFFLYRWLQRPDPELNRSLENQRSGISQNPSSSSLYSTPSTRGRLDKKPTLLEALGQIWTYHTWRTIQCLHFLCWWDGWTWICCLKLLQSPSISLNSLIARKKLKNGLIIGLEPEQPLSKLSWLRIGLVNSK
jgi:hypothetical protein